MANGVSGTKGSSVASTGINTLHPSGEIDPWSTPKYEDKIAWLKQNTLLSPSEVVDTEEAIAKFTASGSSSIRYAQSIGDTSSVAGQRGVLLENYIEKAPQWDNSRNLHRGMEIDEELANSIVQGIKSGKTFDINNGGTASWSTKYARSEYFAQGYGGGVPVIFRIKKMTKATPVMHLSTCHDEMEVFSSKDNNFRPIKARKKNINGFKGWLIDVEQV